VPLFVSSEWQAPPIVAAARASGLVMVDPETAIQRASWAAALLPYNETGNSLEAAAKLLDHYEPTALVAIEALGPNSAGVIHSIMGRPLLGSPAYHHLFELASERGIATLGIGDGGNEIGFGRILDAIQDIQPYGRTCQCPCDKGIATIVKTDALVFAAVSNWGAYGVAAMVALLSESLQALHDADIERRMLERCLAAGAVDGGLANHGFTVDSIDGRVSSGLVLMLATMIKMAAERRDRPY
jgi:hypothetical protein